MSRFYEAMRQALKSSNRSGETWRVGDLGECIREDFRPRTAEQPRVGDLVRIAEVSADWYGVFLALAGKPSCLRWDAKAFRKIVITHEPADAAATELIKRHARQPVEAHHG